MLFAAVSVASDPPNRELSGNHKGAKKESQIARKRPPKSVFLQIQTCKFSESATHIKGVRVLHGGLIMQHISTDKFNLFISDITFGDHDFMGGFEVISDVKKKMELTQITNSNTL